MWLPILFLHVNLVLAAFGGALLGTVARLHWDISTYALPRLLLTEDYFLLTRAVSALGLALLAAPYLAVTAVLVRRPLRQVLLVAHVCVVCAAGGGGAGGAWLAARRVAEWRASPAARELGALVQQHLVPLLEALERHLLLPEGLRELLAAAEQDTPKLVRAAAAAALLLALIIITSAVLAVLLMLQDRRKLKAVVLEPTLKLLGPYGD